MSWIDYWNAKPTIYVSEVHKRVHYTTIADGLIDRLDGARTVLDYGCGEALFAERVAQHCERLYLYDAAETVQAALAARCADNNRIAVLSSDQLLRLEAGSVDLIVACSVIQYLDEAVLVQSIEHWKRLLSRDGRILIADVIPPSVGRVVDTIALLRLAIRHSFAGAAMMGLLRTYFSNYNQLRGTLGLAKFEEGEFIALLKTHGLEAHRVHPNIGHNQARMAFIATLP